MLQTVHPFAWQLLQDCDMTEQAMHWLDFVARISVEILHLEQVVWSSLHSEHLVEVDLHTLVLEIWATQRMTRIEILATFCDFESIFLGFSSSFVFLTYCDC